MKHARTLSYILTTHTLSYYVCAAEKRQMYDLHGKEGLKDRMSKYM